MAYYRKSRIESMLTHLVLALGAAVFSFPFLWMVSTSIKLRREMAAEDLAILPARPAPQWTTPYIDRAEYEAPARPDSVPESVWQRALPMIESAFDARLAAWTPRTVGPDDNAPPGLDDSAAMLGEMREGLFRTLDLRMSDVARRAALEAEAGARLARGEAPPADSELARLLSEESIAAGAAAILAEADRLAGDESLLREIFDDCYRRFCLGAVRALTADYGSIPLYSGREWQVESGPAELVPRYEKSEAIQEVRARFSRESQSEPLVFLFPIDPAKADPARVARLYIGYRADAAWARARFEVIRLGRVYATSDRLHLYDRDFLEQELRWEDEPDPMARRPYMLLRDAGPAPAGAPAFAIRMIVRKAGPLEAWHAKIVRNYHQVFREANFARYYMTSLSLCLLNITLAIFSCSLVAYAFARLRWPGRDLCFGLLLATMMIPSQVTMIPGFLVHKSLGWYNTLLPLWAHAAFGAPFFIFLLRQFLKNVPADLEDAARIDGCGFLRIYWHVMLPLVKPTLATIAIFTFMGVWNNFMGPLIYVNDERLFPLALGIFKLSLDTRTGQDVALMMSGAFIMTLPIILLFFFVQRYFIQGISFTGMKG